MHTKFFFTHPAQPYPTIQDLDNRRSYATPYEFPCLLLYSSSVVVLVWVTCELLVPIVYIA